MTRTPVVSAARPIGRAVLLSAPACISFCLSIEVFIFDDSDTSFGMHSVEIKKPARQSREFGESGMPRHCNKASAASEARQRRSRRGNPDGLKNAS